MDFLKKPSPKKLAKTAAVTFGITAVVIIAAFLIFAGLMYAIFSSFSGN